MKIEILKNDPECFFCQYWDDLKESFKGYLEPADQQKKERVQETLRYNRLFLHGRSDKHFIEHRLMHIRRIEEPHEIAKREADKRKAEEQEEFDKWMGVFFRLASVALFVSVILWSIHRIQENIPHWEKEWHEREVQAEVRRLQIQKEAEQRLAK